jgi:hypothetical protein
MYLLYFIIILKYTPTYRKKLTVKQHAVLKLAAASPHLSIVARGHMW